MHRWARFRTAGSLAACAYAVHSLRYLLAYGSHAGAELHRQGHAYLAGAPIVLTAVLAVGAGELARAAARGHRPSAGGASLLATWMVAALALLAMFSIQELLEGLLATGHPAGIAAVAGGGGWLAAPLSVAFGLVVAVLGRAARAALGGAGARLGPTATRPAPVRLSWAPPREGARRGAGPWRRGRAPPTAAALTI
jgi:hypothetical protein